MTRGAHLFFELGEALIADAEEDGVEQDVQAGGAERQRFVGEFDQAFADLEVVGAGLLHVFDGEFVSRFDREAVLGRIGAVP